MKVTCLFLVLLLVAVCYVTARKRYDGYKLVEISPTIKEHVDWLNHLQLTEHDLDFWQEAGRVGDRVTVLTPPHLHQSLVKRLTARGLHHVTSTRDIQHGLDELWNNLDNMGGPDTANYTFDLLNWNRWSDIMAWMDDLVLSCDNDVICGTYITGNRTFEGRYTKVLKMSTGTPGKRAFFVDSTHHAREWLSTATILNIMNHMVRYYAVDPNVKHMVDNYDWYFLPVANPDGYDYTFTTDRYWRKNRSPNLDDACPGTDLNRNYDFRWGTSGTSQIPCSYVYCGQSPLSEVETQNIAAEMRRLAPTLNAYVTLHTYSNIWMFPWSNLVSEDGSAPEDCELAADHDDLMYVANATAVATANTHNTPWTVGNACQVLYPMSGTSLDYAKGVAGIKYSQLAELRGDDFVVPVEFIPPSSQEIWNGLVAMVYAIESVQQATS